MFNEFVKNRDPLVTKLRTFMISCFKLSESFQNFCICQCYFTLSDIKDKKYFFFVITKQIIENREFIIQNYVNSLYLQTGN